MNLNIDIELNENEKELLTNILNVKNDSLEQHLNKVCEASFEEYLNMILGKKVFTRGQDIREYRLFLLIKTLFTNKIPDEQTISTLFQTTNTGSNSLLRSVFAKYQYDLKLIIDKSIKDVLSNIDKTSEHKTISNIPHNLVSEMNKKIGQINGDLQPITKKRNSVETFEITDATYNALIKAYGLES